MRQVYSRKLADALPAVTQQAPVPMAPFGGGGERQRRRRQLDGILRAHCEDFVRAGKEGDLFDKYCAEHCVGRGRAESRAGRTGSRGVASNSSLC